MMRFVVATLSVMWLSLAHAQAPAGQAPAGQAPAGQAPAGQAIADGATLGAVATLAPLCGLRDNAWSADLRRAAMQAATGTAATDDATLSTAAGSNQVIAALGYGDMEALEDLAADTPAATCAALRKNPALDRADSAVERFRRRRDGKPVG